MRYYINRKNRSCTNAIVEWRQVLIKCFAEISRGYEGERERDPQWYRPQVSEKPAFLKRLPPQDVFNCLVKNRTTEVCSSKYNVAYLHYSYPEYPINSTTNTYRKTLSERHTFIDRQNDRSRQKNGERQTHRQTTKLKHIQRKNSNT